FRPACLPHMRQTLDLSEPAQALEEGIIASKRRPIRRKNTDQRQLPRLRTRHLRQHRRAAEKRDELPPPHATPLPMRRERYLMIAHSVPQTLLRCNGRTLPRTAVGQEFACRPRCPRGRKPSESRLNRCSAANG